MNDLRIWRDQLAKFDPSPWPGPRPMKDPVLYAEKLIGRESEALRFTRTVRENDVVILSGESGVGKTSMLNIALTPTLERSGYTVLVCDEWNSGSEPLDPESFIANVVNGQLPRYAQLRGKQLGLIEQLDRLFPDRGVLVLDQFEELIRYQPAAFNAMLRWIERATEEYRVHIIISLRSEYEHRLSALKLGPFKLARVQLHPLTDDHIVETIIRSGHTGDSVISAEAADRLVTIWRQNMKAHSGIGLLHLQALLFVLWKRRHGRTAIDNDVIDMLTVASGEFDLFEHGLAESVSETLRQCAEACKPDPQIGWTGIDPVIATQTSSLVHAISWHLASGDFKLTHDRETLARIVLGDNLRAHGTDGSPLDASATVDRLTKLVDSDDVSTDWLGIPRRSLHGNSEKEGTAVLGAAGHAPWDLDPDDLTAGAMMGLNPADVDIERRRQFYFALEWLRSSTLIRLTTPVPGQTMISLVHDRYARGLDRWRRENPIGPEAELSRLTAVRGATFSWRGDSARQRSQCEDVTPGLQSSVVANARWMSCRITANMKQVVFVNCDFRGTTFRDCRFEGAVFVNCLLDDVDFVECEIVGGPSSPPDNLSRPQLDEPPSFCVPVDKILVDSFNHLREEHVDSDIGELFSVTSGVPAVVATADNRSDIVPFEAQRGGLTMYGGRLSSLMLRGCRFTGDGTLALRWIAGTSLEIAEQDHARVDIFAAAIRGLTVTRPIRATAKAGQFELSFTEAHVINAWFGVGLTGTARFNKCVVWQLFNSADRNDFTVEIHDSQNVGLINVGDSDVKPTPDLTSSGIGPTSQEKVRVVSERVDYRRNPAMFEVGKWASSIHDRSTGPA